MDAVDEANKLQQEADRHLDERQFKDAADKTARALELRRQYHGEMHPDVAYSINRLAIVAYYQGDYARAETLARDALKIRETTLGAEALDVAESLSDLASFVLIRGDYVQPEQLFRRPLSIYDKAAASGLTSTAARDVQAKTAEVRNNLALLYHRRGDHDRAESEYLLALAITERTRGMDDPTVAETSANLGGTYYASGQYNKAVQALKRALTIQENHLPANHPSLATSNSNLAAVYFDQGDYVNAEALFRRALAIDEQNLEGNHPRLADRLVGLAEVLRLEGKYAETEPLYERALTIRERAFGPSHPQVAETLIARSLLHYARGEFAGAAEGLSRGAELREENLALVLTAGSEDAKRLYLRRLMEETDIAISLHLNAVPSSVAAARLALTSVVQRKGRSLDAMADQIASLRRHLDQGDREVLTQISEAQGRLARMVLGGVSSEQQKKEVASLRADIQRLEETIGARSLEFRATSRKATLEEIQKALPVDAVLIEFVTYRPFSVRSARAEAFHAPRYAAYALRSTGIVASADLGEAESIDRGVQRFRVSLSNPANQDVHEAACALHQALLRPLQASMSGAERLFISPDGALNLIPFAALVDEGNRYLVEQHTISYLTSGHDLLRLQDTGARRPLTAM